MACRFLPQPSPLHSRRDHLSLVHRAGSRRARGTILVGSMARRARHAGAAAAVRVAAVPRAQALSRLDSGVLGISGGQGRAADDNAQRSAPEYLKLSLPTRVEARGADASTGEVGLFWSTVTQSQHIRRNSVSVIVFNCCSRLGMGVQNDH